MGSSPAGPPGHLRQRGSGCKLDESPWRSGTPGLDRAGLIPRQKPLFVAVVFSNQPRNVDPIEPKAEPTAASTGFGSKVMAIEAGYWTETNDDLGSACLSTGGYSPLVTCLIDRKPNDKKGEGSGPTLILRLTCCQKAFEETGGDHMDLPLRTIRSCRRK